MARTPAFTPEYWIEKIGPRGRFASGDPMTIINSLNRPMVQAFCTASGLPATWVKAQSLAALDKCYNGNPKKKHLPASQYISVLLRAKTEGKLYGWDGSEEDIEFTPTTTTAEESPVFESHHAPLGESNGEFSLTPPPATAAAKTRPTPSADKAETAAKIAELIANLSSKAEIDEDRVIELITQHAPTLAVKRIEIANVTTGETKDLGIQHKTFADLLLSCQCRTDDGFPVPVWMTGPAGSGKTTAAKMVAKALGVDFAFNGAIDNEYKLSGFIDANGKLNSRPFRRIYENGGVYLFDEVDSSMPPAVLAFNAALSGAECDFPDGMVSRHKDCIILAAANTWGHGATTKYIGRMKQDAAFLNRFAALDWDIDEDLERATCRDSAWVERVQAVRKNVLRQGLEVIISPRASYFGAALLAGGMSRPKVEQMVLRKGMSDEQWSSIA